jgi:hypothetical protein
MSLCTLVAAAAALWLLKILIHWLGKNRMTPFMKTGQKAVLGASALGLALLVLAGCGAGHEGRYHYSQGSQPRLVLHFSDPKAALTGDWELADFDAISGDHRENEWLNLELLDSTRSQSRMTGISIKDFEWSPNEILETPDQPTANRAQFTLHRPAGEIIFTGQRERGRGHGNFQVRPNPEFTQQVEQLCGETPGPSDEVQLILCKASIDYLRQVKDSGYTVSLASFIRMLAFGISADYAKAMRQAAGAITIDQLIQLRNHGLTPEYARSLKDAGYVLSSEELIQLRNHGVNADFAAALIKGGFDLKAEDLIRLRNSGVAADYASGLKRAGYGDSVEMIVRLRNAGVSVDYLTHIREAGYDFPADQIIQLRNSGTGVDFIAAARKAGYRFTVEELIKLRNHGVSAEYLVNLMEPGGKPLPADLIIQLRNRGVSADTVREIRRY